LVQLHLEVGKIEVYIILAVDRLHSNLFASLSIQKGPVFETHAYLAFLKANKAALEYFATYPDKDCFGGVFCELR